VTGSTFGGEPGSFVGEIMGEIKARCVNLGGLDQSVMLVCCFR